MNNCTVICFIKGTQENERTSNRQPCNRSRPFVCETPDMVLVALEVVVIDPVVIKPPVVIAPCKCHEKIPNNGMKKKQEVTPKKVHRTVGKCYSGDSACCA